MMRQRTMASPNLRAPEILPLSLYDLLPCEATISAKGSAPILRGIAKRAIAPFANRGNDHPAPIKPDSSVLVLARLFFLVSVLMHLRSAGHVSVRPDNLSRC